MADDVTPSGFACGGCELKAAAAQLDNYLRGHTVARVAAVGAGKNLIHVYLEAPFKAVPTEWLGFTVAVHVTGKVRPL